MKHTQCCSCKSFQLSGELWIEEKPVDAVHGNNGNITDSLCPHCKKEYYEKNGLILDDEI
jgi:hypothetical protein